MAGKLGVKDEEEEYLEQMQDVTRKSETVSKKREVEEFRERITHEKEIQELNNKV